MNPGAEIRRIRKALALSPEQLAVRVMLDSRRHSGGVSASLIAKWEKGYTPVRGWSKDLLWNCCLVLRDEAVRQGKSELALEPHELAPHVFPAPAEVKK